MLAMAIAHRIPRSGNQIGRLVSQGSGGGRSQQNCDSNGLPDLGGHGSFWTGKANGPIARRMELLGIGVIAVLGLGLGVRDLGKAS
jgi:hypothetical protein